MTTFYSSSLKPFVFNANDIQFILNQINFLPLFDSAGNALINWDGEAPADGNGIYDRNGDLLWDGINIMDAAGNPILPALTDLNGDTVIDLADAAVAHFGISYPTVTSSYGLRDVTGVNNNLNLITSTYGAVDQAFLRTVAAQYDMDSHGHAYFANETNYATGIDQYGSTILGSAFWANKTFANAFGGAGGFASNDLNGNGFIDLVISGKTYTTNYAVTDANHDGQIQNGELGNIVDYTPRMISLLVTTGGVEFVRDGNGNIVDTHGAATVASWGQLGAGFGIQDAQARFDGTAGQFWVEDTPEVPATDTTPVIPATGHWENEFIVAAQNPGVSPTNGWFTLFGQFFDHGLDFIDKGGQGKSIKITFAQDDPLYGAIGSDGRPATSITISRATVSGFDADGNPEYVNHTSPFIDQSQTYGSNQVVTELLREWVIDPVDGVWKPGMYMLDGETLATQWMLPDGTMTNQTLPTLNELRAHVVETGRTDLTWGDITNYHASGQALILDMNPRFDEAHLMKGDAAQDTAISDAVAFLGDPGNGAIRGESAPGAGDGDSFGLVAGTLTLTLGTDLVAGPSTIPAGTYTGANALMLWVNFANMSVMDTSAIGSTTVGEVGDAVGDILLASVGDHYIAGDGRVNENFGLTTVHHVFHEEHNFQIANLENAIHLEADARVGSVNDGTYDSEYMKQFQISEGATFNNATGNWEIGGEAAWNLDVMFNAAKLTVEMEYQHVAIDQYARSVTPDIKEFVGYTNSENPTVSLEYAQSIFRFGHSQLRETIDTIDPDHGLTGKITGYALKLAFLNPDGFAEVGPGAIALGMTHQQGNEIDEFVTPALNQGLLGLPLDLAAINIARGRDVGIPGLNEFRQAVGLRAYDGWTDFGSNMIHPDNLVNFIAAYSFDGDVAKAEAIMALNDGNYADDAAAITLAGTLGLDQGTMTDAEFAAYAADYALTFMNGGDDGVNRIDTWLGGLAEVHVTGGLLGETFNLVFVDQMERIQDGDRFYYLYRLVNQQFADEVGGGQFKDIIERNTGLTHLGGSAFSYSDQYYDLSATPDLLNTVNNNHKYGSILDAPGNLRGIFSDGGSSQLRDGQSVTVRITDPVTGQLVSRTYIRDTRVTDPNAPNGGLGIDGTDNSGSESTEVIVATRFDDLIYARGGDDTVYGEGGNDIIYGGNGIDRLYGGDGKDSLYGGDGAELTDGGAGDDRIYGDSSTTAAAGTDQLIGGMGNDYMSGGVGIDKLAGGGGDDVIYGEGDTDPFTHGGDGNDYIDGGISGDNLYGDNGDDVIVGAADQDIIYGGNGDDILRPGNPSQALGGGPDEVLGGDGITDTGFDIMDFSDNNASLNGITYDLTDQANPQVQIDGNSPVPAATQIEGLVGSVSNDTLTGDNGVEAINNNWLIGGSGADKFAGGLGNDVIIGGSMRLDTVIGKYTTANLAPVDGGGYTHNNGNDNANASGIFDNGVTHDGTYTQEQMDKLYQGASHRIAWDDTLDSSGLLDAANSQLGGVDYEKHFTEMLRTERFKDMVLGDTGANNTVPVDNSGDRLMLAGAPADYTIEKVNFAGHNVLRITSAAGGSDLVADVEFFEFETGQVFTYVEMLPPVVNIANVTQAEGSGLFGTTDFVFAVTLNHAYLNDVTVTYATSNGSAEAGTDYVAKTGTVTILAGQTSASVTISVIRDYQLEGNEGFRVTLTNPANATIGGTGFATGTIVNDDTYNLVNGDAGNNTLSGTVNWDHMTGQAGNDLLRGSIGSDIMDGGADIDTVDYGSSLGGVLVNLGATTAANGTANTARETSQLTGTVTSVSTVVSTDTLISIENINGSNFGDRLVGGAGDNAIDGRFNIFGADVAVFTGNLSDYTISAISTTDNTLLRIIDNRGIDTSSVGDVVKNVENFEFADGTRTLAAIRNYAPTDIGISSFTPSNLLPGAGTNIATLRAVDPDNTTPLSFSLLSASAPIFGFVSNANNTGTLSLLSGQSMAESTTYNLVVQVADARGLTYTETLHIHTGDATGNTISGVASEDNIFYGLGGDDILNGLGGNDTLWGQAGNDTLNGGDGNDVLDGGLTGNDIINGGAGSDNINYLLGSGTDTVDGGTETDAINVVANGSDNTLIVGFNGTSLTMLDGGSVINVERINASLGNGSDTLSFGSTTAAVTVNLAAGTASGGFVTLTSVENAIGGSGNDSLTGSAVANRLDGGAGQDTLTGGLGDDIFAFSAIGHSAGGVADRITDFTGDGAAGGDVIDLSLVDAIAGGGDDAFSFIGLNAFTAEGQLAVVYDGANTYLRGNTDLDLGTYEFEIRLDGNHSLIAAPDLIA